MSIWEVKNMKEYVHIVVKHAEELQVMSTTR